MSNCKSIQIGDSHGIICLCKTDFNCPKCGCLHTEDDYYNQLDKSKHGLIYKKCKGCKTKLGISSDYKSNVVVWGREDIGKKDFGLIIYKQ